MLGFGSFRDGGCAADPLDGPCICCAAEPAFAYAESQPEHVETWVSPDGGYGGPVAFNAVFAGGAERHEAALRELWGGALCVVEREGPTAGELELAVVADPDGAAQAALDERTAAASSACFRRSGPRSSREPSPSQRRPTAVRALPLLAVVLLAAACGSVQEGGSEPAPPRSLYEADATVLESETQGPMLCLGGIMESLPPQCGDVPVAGWDWDAVEGEESMSGTTWGSFHVVGAYDGETFALVEAGPPRGESLEPDVDFTPPCEEPEGGWAVVDPSRVSEDDFGRAIRFAGTRPDAVAQWVEYVGDMTPEELDQAASEGRPALQILIATFTGDLVRHEAELRELWGGPLCVAKQGELTTSELQRIRVEAEEAVQGELGLRMLWSSDGGTEPRVEIGVAADPGGAAQAALDERYGPGVVLLFPALRPVE